MYQQLHNVGLVVTSIEETIQQYCDLLELNREEIRIGEMKEDRLRLAFIPIGDTLLEVYQPVGPAPRDARHLRDMRTKGEGIFHLAFYVEDYDREVERLRDKGYAIEEDIVTDMDPEYRIRLAWIPPENTGGYWLELIDKATAPPLLK